MTDWRGGLAEVRACGFRLLALTPDPAAIPISAVAAGPEDKIALLVGSEGSGLSSRWLSAADQPVRIPMSRDVDSLNAASATAIACYLLGGSA
jgi:tRNA G18 (ribose-2'-O)-methylase SpoU